MDDVNTTQTETLDDIIFEKLYRDVIKTLSEEYGIDINKWNWGNIHKITLEHPMGTVKILDRIFNLNSDQFGIGGSNHTVCPYTYDDGFKVS